MERNNKDEKHKWTDEMSCNDQIVSVLNVLSVVEILFIFSQ